MPILIGAMHGKITRIVMLTLCLVVAALLLVASATAPVQLERIGVGVCVVNSLYKEPNTRHGSLYLALMASVNAECNALAPSFACGHLYASSVGMREHDFMCLYNCAGTFSTACDDVPLFSEVVCPAVDSLQCQTDLNGFFLAFI